MGYAEMMGHDIPDYENYQDDWGYSGGHYTNSYWNKKTVSKTVEVTLKHETDKAWLVDTDKKEGIWLPKSQCVLSGTRMTMPEWLYEKTLS